MSLLVQDALRAGVKPSDLTAKYAISVKRGTEFPNLVLFKYHQVDSPMGDSLVQQCRGVILDESDNWRVISRPFDKFFNYGEGHGTKLDWTTARVQEKLDGSLMQLYWYKGAWRVGSSGTPDGSGAVNSASFTFADLFWKVWSEMGYHLPSDQDRGTTFLFELMTPFNRVVVRHASSRLVLIGVRDINGVERRPETAGYGWEVVRSFGLQTLDDIEATFGSMDPLVQEGYVVVDANFNRRKVKHPGYVAIHHMRDGFGPKRILEVIRSGESSELLVHFPEWTDTFNKVKSAFDQLVSELEAGYKLATDRTEASIPQGVQISPARIQKEFASHAMKSRCSGALFSLRAGKVPTIRRFLAEMQIKSLMDLLGVKDMEF